MSEKEFRYPLSENELKELCDIYDNIKKAETTKPLLRNMREYANTLLLSDVAYTEKYDKELTKEQINNLIAKTAYEDIQDTLELQKKSEEGEGDTSLDLALLGLRFLYRTYDHVISGARYLHKPVAEARLDDDDEVHYHEFEPGDNPDFYFFAARFLDLEKNDKDLSGGTEEVYIDHSIGYDRGEFQEVYEAATAFNLLADKMNVLIFHEWLMKQYGFRQDDRIMHMTFDANTNILSSNFGEIEIEGKNEIDCLNLLLRNNGFYSIVAKPDPEYPFRDNADGKAARRFQDTARRVNEKCLRELALSERFLISKGPSIRINPIYHDKLRFIDYE